MPLPQTPLQQTNIGFAGDPDLKSLLHPVHSVSMSADAKWDTIPVAAEDRMAILEMFSLDSGRDSGYSGE